MNGIKPAKRAPVTARMSEPQGGLGGKAPSVDRKPILTGKKNARNSGGGTIILDDDDDDLPAPFSSAKRPKLDPEPNVFADRGNAVAGPAPRDDNPAAKVTPEVDYDRRLADLQAQLDEKRKARPPWDDAHFAAMDDITRNMAATRAEKLDAQRVRFGGVARGIGQLGVGVGAGAAAPGLGVTGINPHAGAAPVAQYGFNGGAGYAEALAQAQRAVQAQRAKELLVAGFGGADPGSDSEGDDPMLGALAGMRSSLSGDQDLHDLLKAAAEGESFEGESPRWSRITLARLTLTRARSPSLSRHRQPHCRRGGQEARTQAADGFHRGHEDSPHGAPAHRRRKSLSALNTRVRY